MNEIFQLCLQGFERDNSIITTLDAYYIYIIQKCHQIQPEDLNLLNIIIKKTKLILLNQTYLSSMDQFLSPLQKTYLGINYQSKKQQLTKLTKDQIIFDYYPKQFYDRLIFLINLPHRSGIFLEPYLYFQIFGAKYEIGLEILNMLFDNQVSGIVSLNDRQQTLINRFDKFPQLYFSERLSAMIIDWLYNIYEFKEIENIKQMHKFIDLQIYNHLPTQNQLKLVIYLATDYGRLLDRNKALCQISILWINDTLNFLKLIQ